MEDKQLMAQFSTVIGVLVVIAVICVVLALIFSGRGSNSDDPIAQKLVADRIKPVGQVYVGSVPPEALAQSKAQTSEQGVPASGAPKFSSGKEVFDAVCQACHATGAAGAPKYGDKAAWAKYLEKGIEDMYKFALSGKGVMPPRGGRADLTDENVKSAVDYMADAVK